jgi:hypothetical protein
MSLGIVVQNGWGFAGISARRVMAKVLNVREWVSLVRQFGGTPKRDTVVGVSITLAAWLLGVSQSRVHHLLTGVHQLLKGRKLSAVDVYDERRLRIGRLVTPAFIAHRRRVARPRRTQWQSTRA